MKIESIEIVNIIPYWNNARDNSEAIEKVKESIERFGFNQPIVIDKSNEIIAGHTRYYAMLGLGKTHIPCFRIDLPEDKARQYRIADNKTSEFAKWDMDKLIRELNTLDNPLEMQGFFFEGLNELMGIVDIEFQAPSGDMVPEEVTESDFQEEMRHQNNANAKFDEKIKREEKALEQDKTEYLEISCPHCGEIIRVKK